MACVFKISILNVWQCKCLEWTLVTSTKWIKEMNEWMKEWKNEWMNEQID